MKLEDIQQEIFVNYTEILNNYLDVVDIPKFENYPASTGYHHVYDYGLEFHTYEVVYNVMHLCYTMRLNPVVCFNAAIWHDYGKKWDYEKVDGKWKKTSTYTAQSHMYKSIEEFLKSPVISFINKNDIDHIIHCIKSHHGRKEWDAIELPNTAEALIIHQMDDLSAKYGPSKNGY